MGFRQALWGGSHAFLFALYHNSTISMDNNASSSSQNSADPYKSSSFIGHSLWMCPAAGSASRDAYSSIISETAHELGTFQFLPHITLVAAIMTGEEDVLNRTRQLANQLAPYEFHLSRVSYRDAYFQCVYAEFERSEQVVAANQLARKVFPERQSDPPYTPHLSLVYGDLTETKKVEVVIPKLQAALKEKSKETGTIEVDSIQVWSTQGDVKEWYLVETIPLTGT
ncbi:Cyclic phosphodiesterase-like protein [Seminavis robusta]|uniref:Cyclic phosphodiesterase-like protein n=1 Tax=Seminavis robusta TaxID=568900 RepID=A0A9N8DBA5_9STRA|nr:Cyclic phosphodiesterase-like protein [Seminavis robusta]|eukprot:Sro18_g012970.1 Cyclic phosphodiesterase-like protein (226) ;mRNA; f:110512-111189